MQPGLKRLVVSLGVLITSTAFAGHAPFVDSLIAFDPAQGQLPESLTMDEDGNIFLSMAISRSITKVTPDLSMSTYALLPLPNDGAHLSLGLKVGPDGCLYSVSGAFVTEPSGAF